MMDEDWASVLFEYLEKRYEGQSPEVVSNELVHTILVLKQKILYPRANLTEQIKSARWFEIEERVDLNNKVLKVKEELEDIAKSLKTFEISSVKEEVILGRVENLIKYIKEMEI